MKKRAYLLPVGLFLLVLGLLAAGHLLTKHTGRLTQAAILQKRLSYPLCTAAPDGMVFPETTVEDLITGGESFVYGEITGAPRFFTYSSTDAEPVSFYIYTLHVFQDTTGILRQGDSISLAVQDIFSDVYPAFKDGQKMVFPLSKDSGTVIAFPGQETWFSLTRVGMFYVTGDGYAVSVYDESACPSNKDGFNHLTGLPVDTLMLVLKNNEMTP